MCVQRVILYTLIGTPVAIKAFGFTVPLVEERSRFGSKLLLVPGGKANKTEFKTQLLEVKVDY